MLVFRALGEAAARFFADEPGGHRWQRIPPGEKRGRVHTSTVTVAVLAEPTPIQIRIDERDIDVKTCRSTGSGGQSVNTTDSAVMMTHIPTGLTVRCESEKSQQQNRVTALALLRARLWEAQRDREAKARDATRKAQVGIGARGDKRRTIRCQDDQVNDHVTGKRWALRDYLRGNW